MPPAMFGHLRLDEVIAMFEGWIKDAEQRALILRRKKIGKGKKEVNTLTNTKSIKI